MRRALRTSVAAIATVLAMSAGASPAHADIIFYFDNPGALQPEENVLFNDPALVLSGLTVEGLTNQTQTLIDITGQETLVADGGQAKVSTLDTGFTWLKLEPHNPGTFFAEFEANLKVYSPPGPPPSGTVTVQVTNNFGGVEVDSYEVGSGQNYFSLLAVDPQSIRSILITSTLVLAEIEQIRFGDITCQTGCGEEPPPPPSVPEPAALLLFGVGLMAVGRRMARKRHNDPSDRHA